MSSNPYTLHDYLVEAKVDQPAAFAKFMPMAFTPRPDQVVGLNRMLSNYRFGLFDDPGCVSADTEYLSPAGWKRIDEYDGGLVAQYNQATTDYGFVQPERYVREPCELMIHWKSPHIDQMISPDHDVAIVEWHMGRTVKQSAGHLYSRWKLAKGRGGAKSWLGAIYTIVQEDGEFQCRSLFTDAELTLVNNPEGFKYCFTVPSGLLVLRRNGKVIVTGNCGKTIQLQAKEMQLISQGNKCLLLMPPVLLGQYVESLCESFQEPERYISWHVLQEGPKQREVLYKLWNATEWPQLLLMSYELFVILTRVPKGERKRPELAWILREQYRVVDCDEAHKLCAATTQLHPLLDWHCGEVGESSLALATGTPMPTTPLNAYGLIHLLNPEAYRDFNQFERLHAIYKQIKLKQPRKLNNGREMKFMRILDGFRGQEQIRKHLYRFGRRVIKEKVLSLKEPQIIEVPVVLGKDHMTLYRKLEKERIIEYEGQIIAGGIQEQRLRQALLRIVTNPEAFMPEGKKISNNVLATTLNLIESHNNAMPLEDGFPNKVIIFCNLRATCAWLGDVFRESHGAVVLNGATTDKDGVRRAFLNDPKCRILIANPESAGYGLNFQGVSSTVIYVEPTSVPGDFKQSMERVYRGGQKYVCQVYVLRASGTIAPKATKDMLDRMHEINKVNRDEVILSTYMRRAG